MVNDDGFNFRYGASGEDPNGLGMAADDGPQPRQGDTPIEEARAREEIFIARFENAFGRFRKIYSPLHDTVFTCSTRERDHIRHNHSSTIVDLMKRHRIFERELLDCIPLDESAEFRVFTKKFFGGREVKVVCAALSLSPLEDFVRYRSSSRRIGPLDLEQAVKEVANRPDVFYYMGVLATTGWETGTVDRMPSAPNLLLCLVEAVDGTSWRIRHHGGDWEGLIELYDPETAAEKISRTKKAIADDPELRLKGGHLSMKVLEERLGVPRDVLDQAIEEILVDDPDLSLMEIEGIPIIKRKRF